ncbi:MAG: hypothetical protein ACYS7Y_22955 [Planctomycetota bacterium]
MNKRSKLICAALLGLWCLSVAVGPLQAVSPEKLRDLTAEEISNIKRALPAKPTIKVSEPRKMLVFWKCEGFYHKSIPVVNEASHRMHGRLLDIHSRKAQTVRRNMFQQYYPLEVPS